MANNSAFIELDSHGAPAYLSYDVPQPSIVSGYVAIDLGVPAEDFKQLGLQTAQQLTFDLQSITEAMSNGFADPAIFPNLGVPPNWLTFVDSTAGYSPGSSPSALVMYGDAGALMQRPFRGVLVVGKHGWYDVMGLGRVNVANFGERGYRVGDYHVADPFISYALANLTPEIVKTQLDQGKRLSIEQNMGRFDCKWVQVPATTWTPVPKMVLIERYRVSSFLGNYGPGRVLQTMSLLPGEKTKITLKSYTRRTDKSHSTDSVLESLDSENTKSFAEQVRAEQSDKESQSESLKWHVEAEVEQSWGFVAVQASAGYKGGTNSGRESFAKDMRSALKKHSGKVSSRRNVNVDQSTDTTTESGSEEGIEREIQNINTGRTLNYVFRQMNQEYISILHLVDFQIGYTNGLPGHMERFSLSTLDRALDAALLPDAAKRAAVKNKILDAARYVLDHRAEVKSLIEERDVGGAHSYWRVRTELVSEYVTESGQRLSVPGIILMATPNVMRTSAVIVEALLGQGAALDHYSGQLQDQAVRQRVVANDKLESAIARKRMISNIANNADSAAAALYPMVFENAPPPPLLPEPSSNKA